MFERIDYVVKRIDGDYAYLILPDQPQLEEKCVARALLPEDIKIVDFEQVDDDYDM